MAERIADNFQLYQLDISHNDINLKADSINKISECLSKNHTLTGLHVTGNDLRIDIDGTLLQPYQSNKDYVLARIQSENSILSYKSVQTQNKNLLTFNWISEQWVPIDIVCKGDVIKYNKDITN